MRFKCSTLTLALIFLIPAPLIDEKSGTIYLFYSQWPDDCAQNGDCVGPDDPNHLLYRSSMDNGKTWSAAVNVSPQVKDPAWRSINAGPGVGIQLQWQTEAQGGHNGRLIFPAIRRDAKSQMNVVAIYSDDGGTSWQVGQPTPQNGSTEAEIVELSDGRLLVSARYDDGGSATRHQFSSADGGLSWQSIGDGGIVIPRVDAALIRASATREGDDRDRLIFSGPLGEPIGSGRNRANIGVWISYDEGQTFSHSVQIADGHAAYSSLTKLADGSIGLLYEATGSTLISFFNFKLDDIERK